jgi:peroxiredoxin Q/BCP
MATKKAPAKKAPVKATLDPAKAPAKVAKAIKASAKPVKAAAKAVKAAVKKVARAVAPIGQKPAKTPQKKPASAKAAPASGKSSSTESTRAGAGDKAPSFNLPDQNGKTVSSSSLAGKPYVLYFYPKDDTPGCTKEACGFRDDFGRFRSRGVEIIGVSPDNGASHTRFIDKYGLNFTLLSDTEKELANAYGVWVKKQNYGREYMGIERSTFLVGKDGKIQKAWRGVRVDGHVTAVFDSTTAS